MGLKIRHMSLGWREGRNSISWKYNIRKNVNSEFSIVTMRGVAITVFELGFVKKSMQKFNG